MVRLATKVKVVKPKDDPATVFTQSAQGAAWPPETVDLIKTTAERLRARAITDQDAFNTLVSGGIAEPQARAILRTLLVVTAL